MVRVSGIDLAPLDVEAGALENGLRVRLVSLPHLQTTTISLFVRAGSRYENAENNGMNHLLEHMLYRGCETYPSARSLSLAIEALGAEVDAATHVDFTSYDMTLPPENLDTGLERFAAMLQTPLLTDIAMERRIIREEVLEDLNEAGAQIDADNIAGELVFGTHGLGLPITGPLANIDSFGPEDLREHFNTHYHAKNMVLCVAGPIEPEGLREKLSGLFQTTPAGVAMAVEPPPAGIQERFRFVEDPGSQTDVRLTFRTVGTRHDDSTALALLCRVLDDGLSTRVHRVICEDRGLAYEAFADLESYEDCGLLTFGATCAHDNVLDLVGSALEIVEELRRTPVGDDELQRAKQRCVWDLRAVRDDAAAVNHFVGLSALFGLQEQVVDAARDFDRVTAADLRRVANEQLTLSNASIACVGRGKEARVDELARILATSVRDSPSAPSRPVPTPSSK